MSSTHLRSCPDCGHAVSTLAQTCPSCGRPFREPAPREGLFLRLMNQLVAASFWVLLLIFVVPIVAALIGIYLARH